MELSVVNFFPKSSILDIWPGSECTTGSDVKVVLNLCFCCISQNPLIKYLRFIQLDLSVLLIMQFFQFLSVIYLAGNSCPLTYWNYQGAIIMQIFQLSKLVKRWNKYQRKHYTTWIDLLAQNIVLFIVLAITSIYKVPPEFASF